MREELSLKGMRAKFGAAGNRQLAEQLLATGEKTVVMLDHSDTWGGVDSSGGIPKGQNRFGHILMQVRAELK